MIWSRKAHPYRRRHPRLDVAIRYRVVLWQEADGDEVKASRVYRPWGGNSPTETPDPETLQMLTDLLPEEPAAINLSEGGFGVHHPDPGLLDRIEKDEAVALTMVVALPAPEQETEAIVTLPAEAVWKDRLFRKGFGGRFEDVAPEAALELGRFLKRIEKTQYRRLHAAERFAPDSEAGEAA